MKLEVVVIPVSDVDRAKRFYGGLGWRLDADFIVGDEFRGVQFTPPGSPCSIHFGTGVTSAAPGSAHGLYLVVSDIEAARAELVDRGVDVSEVFHRAGPGRPPLSGPDLARRSYASFSDPDGNSWLLQEVTVRLPGRADADPRHSPRRLSWRPRSDVRQPRTTSTRSGRATMMRTGRTGTPSTSCGSRLARSCRHELSRRR
jgi:catechol 2,3-dioxygenase-like lactoylglutathione lyase family enzyme